MLQEQLFEAIKKQLKKKFGHRGAHIVEDNFRVIQRGFQETRTLEWHALEDHPEWSQQDDYRSMFSTHGIGNTERFTEDTMKGYSNGQHDPLADPFTAISAIPATTGVMRDMTSIRYEVPHFVAENCTGCGNCWTQCPDAAIPGLVIEVDEIIRTGVRRALGKEIPAALEKIMPRVTEAIRISIGEGDFSNFARVAARAYARIVPEIDLPQEERDAATRAFERALDELSVFPIARTNPFFTVPEMKAKGTGGLLAITINPFACKGCMLCVDVCPDQALTAVKQDEAEVGMLRHNWEVWKELPDTPDRFVQIRDYDKGIGVLPTLMLKKQNYESMVGGDGACMGCGEKTAVHLITSTVEASIHHHVVNFVKNIETLTEGINQKLGEIIASVSSLDTVPADGEFHIDANLPAEKKIVAERLIALRDGLKDLHWRYTSGPTGKGRAALGMANSTGCSSVWGSTFPYNPYPYPWVNHLFQDSPSIAIGIFEGHMRNMADAFAIVRKAQLEVDDTWDNETHPTFFDTFTWEQFTDEELSLCPPVIATGGDGAMLDIGFQNLSRLLTTNKPLRVIVLDTQVYSNTGGQACTSGYTGQISDMATFGKAQHGKTETRKELGLLAIAHRGCFVLQSSQATPNHLIAGILRGLKHKGPAIFNIYTPCQTEHGVADDASMTASKLALESRAFPNFIYDPAGGTTTSERLDLDGNPDRTELWPSYTLHHKGKSGHIEELVVPSSIAYWCASEKRFGKHFMPVKGEINKDLFVRFEEYLNLNRDERLLKTPYIHAVNGAKELIVIQVSDEIVALAEERLGYWRTLREMAGEIPAPAIEAGLRAKIEQEFADRFASLKAEYDEKLADLDANYTRLVTDRIVASVLGLTAAGSLSQATAGGADLAGAVKSAAEASTAAASPAASPAAAPAAANAESYIDSFLCTTCNDCINRNGKMFVYNSSKQAEIGNVKAGSYREMVLAAESCPVSIIHPGDPWDGNEPNLEEWKKRAEPFR